MLYVNIIRYFEQCNKLYCSVDLFDSMNALQMISLGRIWLKYDIPRLFTLSDFHPHVMANACSKKKNLRTFVAFVKAGHTSNTYGYG